MAGKTRLVADGLSVRPRYEDEDIVLVAIRDIHRRIKALREVPEFVAWLTESRDEHPEDTTIDDLLAAERLFYELRGGRAVAAGQ
jgi:hypothetical protein